MKIIFDHINGFGKISNQDFIYSPIIGYPDIYDDFDDLLEQGWLPWDNIWFQARSVRYKLSEMNFHKKTKKLSKKIRYEIGQLTEEEVAIISKKYALKKDFSSIHVFNNKLMFESCIKYFHEEKLIGFLCFKLFNRSFIGIQFAWDYEKPSLSLGSVSTLLEATLAMQSGCIYYYMMSGYENCCIYKSDLQGFEFWTGKEWSKDKELYINLCKRDSSIEIKENGNI